MSHDHSHHHGSESNIKVAFFLNLAFTIFEIIGGFYVNSIAILSDAVHDLGDSLSLGTAWYLQRKAKQKPNERYHFGYARFSLLGALINGVILIIGSIFVVNEAISRILEPETSDANGMIVFGIIGVVVNGYAAWKLSKGKTLNERVVSWHLIEDVLGWVAVLIVAIILKFKNLPYLDPALSIGIALFILWGVFKRLKETLHLFLQGIPEEVDLHEIKQEILKFSEVKSIENISIWSLDGEHHVINLSLKIDTQLSTSEIETTKSALRSMLEEHSFKFQTIETSV